MKPTAMVLRHLGAGMVVTANLLLAGCFMANNDDANPIIPAASIAYPLKTGAASECNRVSGECNRVEFVRRAEGGYILRRFETNLLGLPVVKEVPFKLRRLQGAGIPTDTFLVQVVDSSPRHRNLAVLQRESNGRWLQLAPSCSTALNAGKRGGLVNVWVDDDGGSHCVVGRDGLTDQRLFTMLRDADEPAYGSRFIEGG